MKLVGSLIASLFGLEVALLHARLRLQEGTDDEALHDLRINLQRLRSLLAPLRRVADLPPLYTAAAALGSLSAPLRDLEVLAQELDKRGFPGLAAERRAQLPARYATVLDSVELERLQALLDIWPAELREAQRDGQLHHLKQQIGQRLHKQVERLVTALATPGYDRHRLRLLVKRVRYAGEAYPQLTGLTRRGTAALRLAQSTLGDWHDHFQWSARIEREPDLEPLREYWQERAEQALAEAEQALRQLARQLKKDGPRARAALSPD